MPPENIEILRFRAFLEVGGSPDGKKRGTTFPITSGFISATVNMIPTAVVYIATGVQLQNNIPSPIHDEAGDLIRRSVVWPWARIHFQNFQSENKESIVIFEGYVEGSAQSFGYDSTEVAVTIRHWLYALDASPCINALVHPDSSEVFTQFLFYTNIPGMSGLVNAANLSNENNPAGMLFHEFLKMLTDSTETEANLREDIIQYAAVPFVRALRKLSMDNMAFDNTISTHIKDTEDLLNDVSLSVQEVLDTRVKTGDTAFDATKPLTQDQFPILSVKDYDDDMIYRMLKAIGDIPVQSLQLDSVWSMFVLMASQFSFMLVPRVHELRFIPKWFLPSTAKEDIKLLDGAVNINSQWQYSRAIGASVILPSAWNNYALHAGDNAPGPIDNPDAVKGVMSLSYYGFYKPETVIPGTLLVRQVPGWMGEIVPATVMGGQSMEQGVQGDHASTSGDSANDKEKKLRTFFDILAEESYWDERMKGQRADVVCPIRFDVCPGSTVRVRTGYDVRIQRNVEGGDKLATEYVGFVQSVKWTFDTINATASSQYTLSHLRDVRDQANLLKEHPIYRCQPFSNATWTKTRFKTVSGSE